MPTMDPYQAYKIGMINSTMMSAVKSLCELRTLTDTPDKELRLSDVTMTAIDTAVTAICSEMGYLNTVIKERLA